MTVFEPWIFRVGSKLLYQPIPDLCLPQDHRTVMSVDQIQ